MYAGGITSFDEFFLSESSAELKSEETVSFLFSEEEWQRVFCALDVIKSVSGVMHYSWLKCLESYEVALSGTVRSRMRAIKLINLSARSTPVETVSVPLLDDDDMVLVYFPSLTASQVHRVTASSSTLAFATSDCGYVIFGCESSRAEAENALSLLSSDASRKVTCTFHQVIINLPQGLIAPDQLENLEIVSGCDLSFDTSLVIKSCRIENVNLCCSILSQILTSHIFTVTCELPRNLSKLKFPASAAVDGNLLTITGTCPEIAEAVSRVKATLSDLITVRLKVLNAQSAADAAVREFPKMKNAHSLVAAKLEKANSILTLIGPPQIVDAAAKIVPGVISRDAGNLNLEISDIWDSEFWDLDKFPGSERKEISRFQSISPKIDLQGVCNADFVDDQLVSWDPRWVEISTSVILAVQRGGSIDNLPITKCPGVKKNACADLPVRMFPEESLIAGASDFYRQVAFVRCANEIPDAVRTSELLTFKVKSFTAGEIGFLTGKDCATRDKIQKVSGAVLHFTNDKVIIIGTAWAVERAVDYCDILVSQMDYSSDRLIQLIKGLKVAERSDVSVVAVDGFNSKLLRSTEEATSTYCVFCRELRESKIYIFSWLSSRRAQAVALLKSASSEGSQSADDVASTLCEISMRLPDMLQSRVLFQAGPEGQDPPAEELELRLNAKLSPGTNPSQIKVKTNQANLFEARKSIDQWIESNMCSGTIKLPKFHNISNDHMERVLSEMSKRAWMSASTYQDGLITLVGQNEAVNACMKELITWAADEGMDVLTKLNGLERPKHKQKPGVTRRGKKNYSSDEVSG